MKAQPCRSAGYSTGEEIVSVVKRYTAEILFNGGNAYIRHNCNKSGGWVSFRDFDAEQALRLEAERQVVEVYDSLETACSLRDEYRSRYEDLQTKLDTAMGLLRDSVGMVGGWIGNGDTELAERIQDLLNLYEMAICSEDWNTRAQSSDGALNNEAAGPVVFQDRVQPWMTACFGEVIAADCQERNHRFLEEALELVQACGATAGEAHQLVDYVYGRAIGEPAQEVGGVMVTLAALCLAQGMDMHQAAEVELSRIWTKVEQIRAKQLAKPAIGPLPVVYPDRPPAPASVVLPETAAGVWHEGSPPNPWDSEWFLAKMIQGSFVVLRPLPEEYTYDFTTADGTYVMRNSIARWAQLSGSEYKAPSSTETATK